MREVPASPSPPSVQPGRVRRSEGPGKDARILLIPGVRKLTVRGASGAKPPPHPPLVLWCTHVATTTQALREPTCTEQDRPLPSPAGERKWSSSMSSGYSSLEEDFACSTGEEIFYTARTSLRSSYGKAPRAREDFDKEAHPRLTKEEIKEKIEKYNSVVTDKLRMTMGPNGIYTGFIKVQMELRRPITVRSRMSSGILSPNNNNGTAFYLPKGSTNILHISSTNTVHEVIEALLKKFLVADNPAKFVLYKRRQKDDQVCMCKLSDREQPLYLRLVAGPNPDMLSFVLREHETGDVTWEAFSLPELQNFLRILEKEEDEQLQILRRRYSSYKEKLQEALNGVKKPG